MEQQQLSMEHFFIQQAEEERRKRIRELTPTIEKSKFSELEQNLINAHIIRWNVDHQERESLLIRDGWQHGTFKLADSPNRGIQFYYPIVETEDDFCREYAFTVWIPIECQAERFNWVESGRWYNTQEFMLE